MDLPSLHVVPFLRMFHHEFTYAAREMLAQFASGLSHTTSRSTPGELREE